MTKYSGWNSGGLMKNALVYGFARAGTSMTCGVINCLNVHMLTSVPKPKQLMHNPKGMFEIPAHLGPVFVKEIKKSKNYKAIEKKLHKTIHERFAPYLPKTGNWGVKGFGIEGQQILLYYMKNPHVIAIFRNPINQAKSFQSLRYDNDGILTPLPSLIKEMIQNQSQMTKEIDIMRSLGFPVIETTYEDMKLQPWKEAQRIAEFMKIKPTAEMEKSVKQFVDPTLHTWKHQGSNIVSTVKEKK